GRSQVLGIILQPFSARHSGFIVQPLPQVAHHCAKPVAQLGHARWLANTPLTNQALVRGFFEHFLLLDL
ncbi:MAG: hypothetical protein KDE46_10585, partial [Caldilineaceae bacterium]|nr:hypothetical protein [Caldilineaceae bacterium]